MIEARTTLKELFTGARNKYQQRIAGGPDRLPGDEGKHIFASRFGGPGEGINLTAMKAELNSTGQREYYGLEATWAKAIGEGKTVDVVVKPVYTGQSVRPTSYDIEYKISGQMPEIQRLDN